MNKGLGPIAIAAIVIVAALCVEGAILANLIFRMENVRRAIREARIIEAINKLEFVKRALLTSLDFSFFQASYDICKKGGFYQEDCVPYWRLYSSVHFPEFRENLKKEVLKYLNTYAKSLSREVKVPSYDKLEFEKKAMTNLENAILCSYYRCINPEKMKDIPECSEIYGTERYCGIDAESFPVEFYGKGKIEKNTLGLKMSLDCIRVEGISKQYSSFFDYFSGFLHTLQSLADLIVRVILNLGKVELNYIIVDKGAVIEYGQQGICFELPSFDSLELSGELIQVFTYKEESFKLGIDPFSIVITVKTTFIRSSPPNFIDLNVSSPQNLMLEESDMKLTETSNMKKRYFTQIFKMFDEAKSRFYDEDSVYNSIITAIQSLPSECKTIRITSCSPINTKADEILNQQCPNILETLKNKIKDEILKINSVSDRIKIIVEIDDIKTDSEGSCSSETISSSQCCSGSQDSTCVLYVVNCNYEYYGAVKVLVRVRDESEEYPVYDTNEGTTDFRKNELRFYVLSGNRELITIPTNACQS